MKVTKTTLFNLSTKKIKIIYNENKNTYTGNDRKFIGLTDEEKRKNIVLEKEGKTKISPVGCGKSFKWNDSLVHDCTDEIILFYNNCV